jgi:hypothetical protein
VTIRRLSAGSAALLVAGLVTSTALTVATSTSMAAAGGGGTPGYCPTDDGVTVVVDFQQLGGDIVVRCAPAPVGRDSTGLDALRAAGFTPEGVRRYGLAFVCRIEGRPAADEELPIQGDPHYHEACLETPPQQAFWGYWYAPNDGSWTYSQTAAISRHVIPGGFEGWSFSLNHAAGDAPKPGIAPRRPQSPPTTPPPHTTPPHTTPPHTPPAHTSPPYTTPTHTGSATTAPTTLPRTRDPGGQPIDHSSSAGGVGRHHRGSATPTDRHLTQPAATTQAANPVVTGRSRSGARVTGELPQAADDPGGSAAMTVVGVGAVALLTAGAGLAAWRRRTRRG